MSTHLDKLRDPDGPQEQVGFASFDVSSAVRRFAELANRYPLLATKEADDMRLNIRILQAVIGRDAHTQAAE